MSDFFTGLKELPWFKAATGVGASLAIAAFAGGLTHAAYLSLGLLFFAVGEWINHPIQHQLGYRGYFTWRERRNRVHGIASASIGVALMLLGLYGLTKEQIGW